MDAIEKMPVLELKAVVFEPRDDHCPFDLTLRPGELAYLPGFSRALHLLGINAPASGEILFRGQSWESRSVVGTESGLRRIGTVVNPLSHPARIWIGNLDIDENVHLASQFDPLRTSDEIEKRAAEIARLVGLGGGLPSTRPTDTDFCELVLAQWVRALLPRPLDLLILESPTEFVGSASISGLVQMVEEVRAGGTAVLWIAETVPPFSNIGLRADIVLG